MFAETATPVFATGVLFGALLLFAGLSIGIWIGRRSIPEDDTSLDNYHLGKLLRGLFHWTDGFASDVSKYSKLMANVKQQLSEVHSQTSDEPTPVVAMLTQIVQANDLLQHRLNNAEKTLQDQATEIASYLSEARTDTLTGLPNRRVFDDELSRRLAEFRRNCVPLSVAIVDIDHFKRFNDEYGHLAGDAVLTQVANVLNATMRESDLVARLGGEEFAIVLPGADAAEASQAAERGRLAVDEATFHYEGQSLHVTISCGAARATTGEDATSLVKRADQALYAAKAVGRNCAYWHNGRETVAITPPRPGTSHSAAASPAVVISPANPAMASNEFLVVCDELRQRLQAVMSSPRV